MKNLEKALSIVELEERHEMSVAAPGEYTAADIGRCEGRCRGVIDEAIAEQENQIA
ncbi:hypothetical protein ACFQ1M_04715 [Sungkyunkwania multivorans]|uniref:Uncharacterized protein n=1 Tax=Sungkyunkwania multivorans TaxID=1173618 RepID=A0ABW3CY13_9FLAO